MPSTPNNGQQLYFNARSPLQLQWRRNDTTNGSLALHGDLAWLLIHVSVLYMCRMQYAVASLCVRCTMHCTMPHNTTKRCTAKMLLAARLCGKLSLKCVKVWVPAVFYQDFPPCSLIQWEEEKKTTNKYGQIKGARCVNRA